VVPFPGRLIKPMKALGRLSLQKKGCLSTAQTEILLHPFLASPNNEKKALRITKLSVVKHLKLGNLFVWEVVESKAL